MWFKSLFAVDNAVNEQSVSGFFWLAIAAVAFIVRACGVETISDEMLYMALGASLASLGISGFKRN